MDAFDNLPQMIMNNFDFTLMFIINIASYILIKLLDEVNGEKVPTVLQKRLIFIFCAIIISIVYVKTSTTSLIVAVNSVILAPVSWSWIFRPIINKIGLGYKQKVK